MSAHVIMHQALLDELCRVVIDRDDETTSIVAQEAMRIGRCSADHIDASELQIHVAAVGGVGRRVDRAAVLQYTPLPSM